nr:glycosyltransferase family 2 protein [Pseudomaricurvus sp. HS19]
MIPVYNHPAVIANTVAEVRALDLPVVLIDDGSEPQCAALLRQLAAADPRVHLQRLPQNRGKGGAVKAGFLFARHLGFSHALQIDADGQHDTGAIGRFLDLAREHPHALVAGYPLYDESVPKVRYYSRYLTHVWVWINTLSLAITDSMCGFRVYPLEYTCRLTAREHIGERMDFDIEFIVRWFWSGAPVEQLPIRVHYPEDGVSHFRGWADNWLISKMHARLFFGMLWRAPLWLLRGRRGA